MRRASHDGLNNTTAPNYHPAQLREAAFLVDGMLKDTGNWNAQIYRHSSIVHLRLIV